MGVFVVLGSARLTSYAFVNTQPNLAHQPALTAGRVSDIVTYSCLRVPLSSPHARQ
ncbi:hypothetical protein SAMN05216276_100254 [Streptosporangium subroseum]|uniref:Uncharacterized protein n=1 Tax=Streptosporangium subroseum TaxID=106412 RepID=A0A239APC3_9ACTN|nr:hypothetical protein SAMN05216276_100254 [Streptosporangium subroseum]